MIDKWSIALIHAPRRCVHACFVAKCKWAATVLGQSVWDYSQGGGGSKAEDETRKYIPLEVPAEIIGRRLGSFSLRMSATIHRNLQTLHILKWS
jgi:hypothetical protein